MVALSDDNWLTVDDKQVGVGETREVYSGEVAVLSACVPCGNQNNSPFRTICWAGTEALQAVE
jgi:hypothetical protein